MDAYSNFDFYIAFPVLDNSQPANFGGEFLKHFRGPLAGRHVYQDKGGKRCFSYDEFAKIFVEVMDNYCELMRPYSRLPAPIPLILPKGYEAEWAAQDEAAKRARRQAELDEAVKAEIEAASNVAKSMTPVVEPIAETVAVNEPVAEITEPTLSEFEIAANNLAEAARERMTQMKEESAPPETAKNYAEIYAEGDRIKFNEREYEIESIDGSIANCYKLTAGGSRAARKGKPVMEEIDLSTIAEDAN